MVQFKYCCIGSALRITRIHAYKYMHVISSRVSVSHRDLASPHRDLGVLSSRVERWMIRGKIASQDKKSCKFPAKNGRKLRRKPFFFWSLPDFGEK